MKQKKFSEFLKDSMAELGFTSLTDFSKEIEVPYRTLMTYVNDGAMDGKEESLKARGIAQKIAELKEEKKLGLLFPQKETPQTERLNKLEVEVKKLQDMVTMLYERLGR